MADLALDFINTNVGQKGNLTIASDFDIGNDYIKFCSSDNRVRSPTVLCRLSLFTCFLNQRLKPLILKNLINI